MLFLSFLPFLLVSAFAFTANAQSSSQEILKDFTSDGCSMSPDGWIIGQTHYVQCCVEHDVAYWRGGTRQEKLTADLELKQCIKEKSNSVVAEIYYRGVRVGGVESLPTNFHWGYGWTKRRNYRALSEQEQQMVDEKLSQVDWQALYRSLGIDVP
ncbi:helicase [Bdellovibrio sp. HCB2-146]|uniref:helicase n=1 Tax=Bdellovibrio sp. HCB2-146 TaxID=3394362 RepID=UPI0039BC9B87